MTHDEALAQIAEAQTLMAALMERLTETVERVVA